LGSNYLVAKTPDKKTKQAYEQAINFGCVVCKKYYGLRTDATIHHLTGAGMGLKSKKFIPLCPEHHQGNTGVHHNTKLFEERFGTQEELLDWYLQNINK
jgi:hypothetical protein